jgi:hypothetical protein
VERAIVYLELEAITRDLGAGGVFVRACPLAVNELCDVVVTAHAGELRLEGRVVYADGHGGAGLELVGFNAELRQQLADMLVAPEPDPEPAHEQPIVEDLFDESASSDERRAALTMHERLRGLTLVEQMKKCHSPDPSERMLLERMYGRNVWEHLLRNPRLTAPEVARIARMGALPRPLIELVVSNGSWLAVPEVRRALLSNPRLGADQILRVLRLVPKHELKVTASQTVYPHAVRDAAKRLLRELGG